jgi:ketosteroid isomerase-like protein
VRAALACLAVGSLVACGGGGGGGAAPGPKQPVGPAIDPATAQQGASDLITEIYDTLGRGNKDSVFTLLENTLIVFGPRGGDMLGTRADALVALGQVVDPKAKKNLAITSDKIDVIAGPGGHSAIAFDPAILNGQPHAILAVLDNTNDLWLVGTVAIAHTPTEAQLKAELAKDAVVPPAATGIRKLDPAARPAVEKFQRGLLDQASWGEELASHKDAIVIGPTGGEVARGKQAIRELWRKRVDARTRAAVAGEITAAVTGDGQLAWVSAPITRVEGEGTQPLPLRAFAVYQRDGGDWKLLALEESIAFSTPGAGASFKRFLPPRPVEPKAPEVIAARPKDGGSGKGKAEAAKDRPEDRKGKPALAAAEPKRKKQPEVEEAPRKKEKAPEKQEPEKKVTAKEARADDADESPRRKKKKRSFGRSDDDGADAPKQEPEKKVTAKEARADDADESPRRKRKKRSFGRSDDESAVEESPKKQKPARAEADEESPRKRSRAKAEADEESPKKKQKLARAEDAEEESPKKKGKAKAEPEAEAETPRKKSKSKSKSEDAEEASPKKKKVAKSEDAEEASPKKKKVAKSEDAEEASPKKKKAKAEADEESPKKKLAKTEEEEAPKKKAKTEDVEETPKKKAKAKAEVEATEEAPKKKAKAKAEVEATEEAPKKKAKAKAEDAEEAPKKKKKPAAEAEDEVEVID